MLQNAGNDNSFYGAEHPGKRQAGQNDCGARQPENIDAEKYEIGTHPRKCCVVRWKAPVLGEREGNVRELNRQSR